MNTCMAVFSLSLTVYKMPTTDIELNIDSSRSIGRKVALHFFGGTEVRVDSSPVLICHAFIARNNLNYIIVSSE